MGLFTRKETRVATPAAGYTEYCAGMPFTGMRPLGADELAALNRERKGYLKKALLYLSVLCFSFFGACMSIAYDLNIDLGAFDTIFVILTLLVSIIGVPLLIVYANDNYRHYGTLKGTCSRAFVRHYEGRVNFDDWTDPVVEMLNDSGLLIREPDTVNSVELLSDRDTLYRINGQRAVSWGGVGLTIAAGAPEKTVLYALPKEWGAPDSLSLLRRRLSDDEKVEIEAHVRNIQRRRWSDMFWLSLLLAYLAKAISRVFFKLTLEQASPYIAILVVSACAFIFLNSRKKANELLLDLEGGWVVQLDPDKSDLKGAPIIPAQLTELLPVSTAVWRIGDKPAGWRNAKG
ncbi:MAG: hypothetical protein HZA22_00550 [Nitrospirae bacterium]|nr:hypothetical protein [Nitrospirota bacterium]